MLARPSSFVLLAAILATGCTVVHDEAAQTVPPAGAPAGDGAMKGPTGGGGSASSARVVAPPSRDPLWAAPKATRLLVIGPEAFRAPLEDLIAHKNAAGMPAWLVTIEQVRLESGKDDPEKLKRLIERAARTLGTQYVMLAGDASLIPARHRYVHNDGTTADDANHSFNPTDLYYANLYVHAGARAGQLDTWDLNGNGLFDEQKWGNESASNNPDEVDGVPDIAVGRVPAHTAEELAVYVKKIILHETGVANPYGIARAGFIADKNYPGASAMLDGVAQQTFLGTLPFDRLGVNYADTEARPFGWDFGNFTSLDGLAYHAQWVSFTGHAYSGGWGAAEAGSYYDGARVRSLHNTLNLPIVFTAGCEAGRFMPNIVESGTPYFAPDAYDVPSASDRSFASAWLLAPNMGGGIAFFGHTSVMHDAPAIELQKDVLHAFGAGDRVLGDMWIHGQGAYATRHATDEGVFTHPRIYLSIMTMFADPSLRVR